MKTIYKYILLFLLLFLISCYDGGDQREETSFQYPTLNEIDIFLEEINSIYPGIARIEIVGKSELNRDIKALIISDDPNTSPRVEPAVRLIGGIHGNEKMSVELLIRFIEYLTSNYEKDTTVTNIINSRYICIIPVLNPDGYALNTRYNSRGVDLNRNFDDAGHHWESGTHNGTSAFSESETTALKDYSLVKDFDISITYHTGSVLVNLPFDYGREIDGIKPVQNELVKSYAKTYTLAGAFLTNPDMYLSDYMDEGTINGGNWYVATGTLQDWSYTVTGCLDLTIEVSRSNPSSETGVQQVFIYNRDSITAYISRAGEDIFTGL